MTRSTKLLLALSVFSSFAFASPAFAQSDANIGIAMGTPATLNVIWHATDRIAFRPEISFSHSSGSDDRFDVEDSSTSFTPGVSVLFYVSRWESVRTYVTPRYVFSHFSAEHSQGVMSAENSASAHDFSGSFGVQFTPHRRFAIYGELGLSVSYLSDEDSTNTNLGIRSGIGAIFYF